MPQLKISSLLSKYESAKSADDKKFSVMKSNARLVNGDHYLNGIHKDLERSRYSRRLSSEAKLRLTQNHISRASNLWVNSILNAAPDVQILPNNEYEEGDKKAAEMHMSAKEFISRFNNYEDKKLKLVKDFWDLGECALKIYYDPTKGPLVDGDIVEIRDENGLLLEMYQEQKPMGMVIFERIMPFNLLRDPVAKEWDECRWMIYRKMFDKRELMSMFPGEENEEKRAMIQESQDETYKVYDTGSSEYTESKKVLILEYYFRPSKLYPKGYYAIATTQGILDEGPLPGGVFPIEVVNFDDVPTCPRGVSKIKQLRPIQAEINRAVTKMAEHQITLGDDKLIIRAGAKIAESNKIAGVRAIQVAGAGLEPTILAGRSGNQYVDYWLQQVEMFDRIAEIPKLDQDKMAQLDPYGMLLMSMREKKRFSIYASKFERFQIRVWEKALKVLKHHIPAESIIPMVGRHDCINIDEFKSSDDLSFQIKLKPRTDDPESLVARQFAQSQILQYKGGDLSDVDFGELVSDMPFFGKRALVTSGKIKSDRARNMILKLDKGKDMRISEQDDPAYMLQKLDSRMSEADFDSITHRYPDGRVVPTEVIHQLYERKRQEYLQLQAEQLKAQQMMAQGQIPTSGELVPVQMYTSELKEDGSGYKVSREHLPHDALVWLKEVLMKQGMTEQTMASFGGATQADLAQMVSGQAEQAQVDEATLQELLRRQ